MPIFDAWPGEKLAIKIADIVERAGVGLLRPMQLRREGRARAEVEHMQRLAIAQADMDVADLAAGRVNYDPTSGLLLPAASRHEPPTLSTLPPLTAPAPAEPSEASSPKLGSAYGFGNALARTVVIREAQRALNLERIVQKANAEATSTPDAEVSEEPVHPDWFSRWRDGAQDVSDEDVQRLWARALAGEARAPGQYSLRTLDFLRSVSQSEAELIAKLGPFAVGEFVYRDQSLLEKKGFRFDVLGRLQQLGILANVDSIGVVWIIDPSLMKPTPRGSIVYGMRCAELGMVCRISERIEIPCYTITSLGREMLTLGQFEADREYFNALAKNIASNGATCRVGAAAKMLDGFTLLPPVQQFDPPSQTTSPA